LEAEWVASGSGDMTIKVCLLSQALLPHISLTSPSHLPHISLISPSHLPHISQVWRLSQALLSLRSTERCEACLATVVAA